MKTFESFAFVAGLCSLATVGVAGEAPKAAALDFTMNGLDGKPVALSTYLGKVVLVVNTASKCGLTPQYTQLQALHESHGAKGLAVLGFPCNQFGAQEPGTAEEIGSFCTKNYGVTFAMFDKIDVNGDGACALYKHLKALPTTPVAPGEISWNFEKFLINRKGAVIARFGPKTKPDDPAVTEAIEKALTEK